MDVLLPKDMVFEQAVDMSDNIFIYVFNNALLVGEQMRKIGHYQLGVLHEGN